MTRSAAVRRLRQPLLDLLGHRLLAGLGASRQAGEVTGQVRPQVRHDPTEALGQDVEDGAQSGEVRLGAEHFEEAGEVPIVGNVLDGAEAEEAVPGRVAVQFGDAGGEGGVTQGDGEDNGAPQDIDGEVVASLAACVAEAIEESLVGEDFEEEFEGGELGVVVEFGPGEAGVVGMQSQEGLPRASEARLERDGYPVQGWVGVKRRVWTDSRGDQRIVAWG